MRHSSGSHRPTSGPVRQKSDGPIDFRIQHFDELVSTNSRLQELANEGAPEGLVVVADFQTAGRGRFDRKWISARGENLLCSILFRPKLSASRAPIFTQHACEAVAGVLRERFNLDPSIKGPNDVLIRGRKICGILVESKSATRADIDFLVMGIGLNVNSEASSLPDHATSIKIETGNFVPISDVLSNFLEFINMKLQHPIL